MEARTCNDCNIYKALPKFSWIKVVKTCPYDTSTCRVPHFIHICPDCYENNPKLTDQDIIRY